ncbi:multidrug resistance-associated protein 4-like [Solenopsis invicta]|uniref:multidrug resistance-associated protein 4-like n=1 Tax=Solenopsis invicta TaxID=13686 RepID=UPI0005958838|nr:multidrug resistance-associated protein 4-like [Solenopsis invicta]
MSAMPISSTSLLSVWSYRFNVEVKEAVTTNGNGLESRVFDRGSNFSNLDRNNEVTPNIDPHTDALIQRTIRKKFATRTMLTVAHRLNTIKGSDKVLMMDKSRLAEYDHPHMLLKNSYSQFTLLVRRLAQACTINWPK